MRPSSVAGRSFAGNDNHENEIIGGNIMKTTQLTFGWTTFYMEFADKLLAYKNNRMELMTLLEAAHKQVGLRYPFVDHGQLMEDVCPFTVFGAFNKGITTSNRIALINAIGQRIGVTAVVPSEFDGVPVMNNMMAWFFGREDGRQLDDIDNLWNMFEDAINYADSKSEITKSNFVKSYNIVTKQTTIKWNLTMALYWIRPYSYLNLDGKNREYLLQGKGATMFDINPISKLKILPDGETYLKIVDVCLTEFSKPGVLIKSFPELSLTAWTTSVEEKQDKTMSKAYFLKWFSPLISALKTLGGAATPEEVRNQIIDDLSLSEEVVSETRGKLGTKKFNNDVAWARAYLVAEGLIDNSQRGLWSLTDKGKVVEMTEELASEIKLRWQSKVRETENNQNDVDEQERSKHFWLYAPGEGAKYWNEYYSNSLMCIGAVDIGDIHQYSSREDIRNAMREHGDSTKSYKMDSLAAWQFVHDLQIGDIVYAKKGMHEIIGRGVVESEYSYVAERDDHKHVRRIKWTQKGEWKHPGQAAMKTLTDITSYTEYVQKLELLIMEDATEEAAESEVAVVYPPYSDEDFLGEAFISRQKYEKLVRLLKTKKNIILQGAPGVGKTFTAKRLAYSIIGEKDVTRVSTVQFHQSYSYEDFIMGYRPTKDGFELKEGPFYSFCKKAQDDLDNDYFFIIDEINRGNLSKIFGELLMLIENDKRGEKLRLLYANELFSVPKNLHIIGLMNTADRSLAMIDYALRRRFAFYQMEPAFDSDGFQKLLELAGNRKFDDLIRQVKTLNEAISKDESLGDGFLIGHSYFCTDDDVTDEWMKAVIEFELLPLLSEYWFDEKHKVEEWTKKLGGALND